MRIVDADRLLEILEREEKLHSDIPTRADGIRDAIMDVISAQTVDAVPVVRCKDCVRYRPEGEVWGRCTMAANPMRKKDFCSYGVRKDGDHETD